MPGVQYSFDKGRRALPAVLTTIVLASAAGLQAQEIQASAVVEACEANGVEYNLDCESSRWIRFQSFVKQWREERGTMSSIDDMSALVPFQNIIGMGIDAVPLLLAQLKSEGNDPDQWFWALLTIAKANDLEPPQIAEEDQGNYLKMAKAWITWGENQVYAG